MPRALVLFLEEPCLDSCQLGRGCRGMCNSSLSSASFPLTGFASDSEGGWLRLGDCRMWRLMAAHERPQTRPDSMKSELLFRLC